MGSITFSTQSRKNKKGLVAIFSCSRGPPPLCPRFPGRSGTPLHPAIGPGIWGLAAKKCCYQPTLFYSSEDEWKQ